MHRMLATTVLGSMVLLTSVYAGGALKSGPQTGQELPGAFHPLNITGEAKGEKHCLYCAYGDSPVAAVFARDASPAVAKLLKQLDEATIKNAKAEMGSYAVFCSDKNGLDKQLEMLAKDQKLTKLVLAIDNPTGPEKYKIAKEADVTVVLYTNREVKVNYAFRKGELTDAAIAKVVGDVAKITAK
jgi:hypothetical protein